MTKTIFKILFIFLMSISASLPNFALTPAQNLSLIENHIFGHENSSLKEVERLNKIEQFVYGSTQNMPAQKRLAKLNTDLGMETGDKPKQPDNIDYANEPTDPSAQYPIVDNIENSLLNQIYKAENIYKRLDRLEKKAYGKVMTDSLSDRVDRLALLAKPITPQQTRESFDDYMANNDDYNYFSPTTTGSFRSAAKPQSVYDNQSDDFTDATLLSLERNILGRSYSSEDTQSRLARLEKKLLHREFTRESDESRLERLATVANAQKSSKIYKDNKLQQHLATGVQVGSMILMILAMLL